MEPKKMVTKALQDIPGWEKMDRASVMSRLWETCGGLSYDQIREAFSAVVFNQGPGTETKPRLLD